MTTREENAAAGSRETEEIEANRQLRRADLQWAEAWHEGSARCPSCDCTEFGLMDLEGEAQARYESHSCRTCGTRWKVEFREAALVVLREESDDDWIELPVLSESDTAMALAALRFWRKERLVKGAQERNVEAAGDHFQPHSDAEIDALCERIAGLDRGLSGASKA